jgi:hypothetical protein
MSLLILFIQLTEVKALACEEDLGQVFNWWNFSAMLVEEKTSHIGG